jgi:hypothetical protein
MINKKAITQTKCALGIIIILASSLIVALTQIEEFVDETEKIGEIGDS